MPYHISMIAYSNMAPYRMLGTPEGCTFLEYTPRESVAALKTGRVFAAPLPVAAIPLLEGQVATIGSYGIAAAGQVGSVLLFSRCPFDEINAAHRVGITDHTASSVRLLQLFLNTAGNKQHPAFVADDRDVDALLLIGDRALMYSLNHEWPYVTDLATVWFERTGLPFVFARWVVRQDAPAEVISSLGKWLDRLKDSDAAMVELAAPVEARRLGVDVAFMKTYLTGMIRILGTDELRGQELFLAKLKELPDAAVRPALPVGPGAGRVSAGRLDRSGALELFQKWPLGKLMRRAFLRRLELFPDTIITYVRDTNPNYTNICETGCAFCAFRRKKGDEDAYILLPEELAERVKNAAAKGASTVLLQGGNNPEVTLEDWVGYILAIRKECPDMHIHPFSPSEIYFLARKEGMSSRDILAALFREGIRTIPGGGGEILVDAVRSKLSPEKCPADDWLRIMKEAHETGFTTTATMMYGHIESDADCIEHLFRLRELQDYSRGFSSFIPWSFKPGYSDLTERITSAAHPARYVRILALARLVLDNFDHVQSSWFSESENAGEIGLLAGADDFGGILLEEHVLATSGYKKQTTEEKVKDTIRRCGFTPALRNSQYQLLEVFHNDKDTSAGLTVDRTGSSSGTPSSGIHG